MTDTAKETVLKLLADTGKACAGTLHLIPSDNPPIDGLEFPSLPSLQADGGQVTDKD